MRFTPPGEIEALASALVQNNLSPSLDEATEFALKVRGDLRGQGYDIGPTASILRADG